MRTAEISKQNQELAINGSPAASQASTASTELLFELVTGALYHRARVAWFAGLHRGGMFANILAGTAAVAFIRQDPFWSVILALILAIITSANLAFDFSALARKHEDARRDYHDLAATLEEGKGDAPALRKLRARMIRASATEPLVFDAAEKVAYNRAIESLGLDPQDGWYLSPWQRFWRHFWPYSGTKFEKIRDRERRLQEARTHG